MSLRVLHLVVDDKFIDDAVVLFDSINSIDCTYWFVSNEINKKFRHIKSNKVVQINVDDFLYNINVRKSFDVVVLHGFSSLSNRLILKINPDIKLVWFSWGYDIYSNMWPEKKLIKLDRIKSKNLFIRYSRELSFSYMKSLIKSLFLNNSRKEFKKAIGRVDYYSGVFPEEFDMISENNAFFKAKKISFNYSRKTKSNTEELGTIDNWILIGNSSSYLLNHIDVFDRIKSYVESSNRKVLVPLNYGDLGYYRRHVLKCGIKTLGENFYPIVDFLTYSDYYNLLRKCSVAIFNIEQQAAVGNICMCLSLGIKVFLPIKSIGYKFFKRIGAVVYSIEEELLPEIHSDLSSESIRVNRAVVKNYFSFDVVKNRVIESFKLIENDVKNNKKMD